MFLGGARYPADIGCNVDAGPNSSNWTGCHYDASTTNATKNPALYYWSSVWGYEWAALQMKAFTDLVKQYLPNAGVGANFESTDMVSQVRNPYFFVFFYLF